VLILHVHAALIFSYFPVGLPWLLKLILWMRPRFDLDQANRWASIRRQIGITMVTRQWAERRGSNARVTRWQATQILAGREEIEDGVYCLNVMQYSY
jgi:hypothetical protein